MLRDSERVGELDLGGVPRQWRKIDFVARRAVEVSQSPPIELTRVQIDESRSGGHRLYPSVERALGSARDCDLAIRILLENHGATQTAVWALLRTEFEAAFWALWYLDPDESTSRVLRGIQGEWRDDRASQTYFREFADDDTFPFVAEDRKHLREQVAQDHAATFKAEAIANGANWEKPPDINMTLELTRLSHVTDPGWGSLLRGAWRSLAGLQHGSTGALLRVSDQTKMGVLPGGVKLLLSPRDSSFQQLASVTLSLHLTALSRYIECHQPLATNAPVDLRALRKHRSFWHDH